VFHHIAVVERLEPAVNGRKADVISVFHKTCMPCVACSQTATEVSSSLARHGGVGERRRIKATGGTKRCWEFGILQDQVVQSWQFSIDWRLTWAKGGSLSTTSFAGVCSTSIGRPNEGHKVAFIFFV
jgi:hypothetical protein